MPPAEDAVTQCVVLAGGLGTRMRPATEQLPKALLEANGRPFVDHQLDWMAAHGVGEVVFCIGHLGEQLRAHVGDGRHWGLRVDYADEGENLRGTAGALRVALDAGLLEESFWVLYGDSFLPIDFREPARAYAAAGLTALMTVFKNDGRWDSSNVLYADGRVQLYDKHHRTQPPDAFHHIDYGLSVLSRRLVAERIPASGTRDLAELFFDLSRQGHLAGYEVRERFYEIGSPGGLRDFEQWLKERDV